MKKLFLYLAVIGLTTVLFACNRDNPGPPKTEENITLNTVEGIYYGPTGSGEAGEYSLLFRGNSFDPESNTTGGVWEFHTDIFSEISEDTENAVLTAGYYFASSSGEKNTFAPGKRGDTGTYFISHSGGSVTKHYIASGTIKVAVTDGSYTLTTDITDEQGIKYKCTYEGEIEFTFTEKPDPNKLVADNAGGTYIGDLFGDGFAQFDLWLTKGTLDEFGDIEGDGFKIYFETFSDVAANPSSPILKGGDYDISEIPSLLTFRTGYLNEDTGKIMGTRIMEYTGGVAVTKAITDGKFTLEENGGSYILSAELEDSDGRTFKASYNGTITFRNISDIPDSNTMDYCEGNYYGDRKGKGSGEYLLDVYMMDFNDDFKMIFRGFYLNGFMKLASDPANAEIETGIYTLDSDVTGTPFTFTPGIDTDGSVSGSYYYETDIDMATMVKFILITEGTYVVTRSGDDFTFLMNFSGIDRDTGETVRDMKYKFTGTVSIADMTN